MFFHGEKVQLLYDSNSFIVNPSEFAYSSSQGTVTKGSSDCLCSSHRVAIALSSLLQTVVVSACRAITFMSPLIFMSVTVQCLYTLLIYVLLLLYALSFHWLALDVVHTILNMQRYVTSSVAGQTCSFSGKAVKGGSQYLYLNQNVPLLRHRQFYPSDMASPACLRSHAGKTCYENVWTITGFCDMKNLPRSLSRHARSKNNIQNQNCFKHFWKRNDILWLWTNSGD